MNCKEIHIGLLDFTEGNLSEKEKSLFESHLESCESCRQKLAFLEASLQVLDKDRISETDPFYFTRLEQRMSARETLTVKRSLPGLVNKWAVAAMIIAIVGGVWLGSLSVETLDSYSSMDKEILASEILPGIHANTFSIE